MIYLRVRKIEIDVVPNAEPFVNVHVEKVIEKDGKIIQVIGTFDRVYKKISDVPPIPVEDIADDGVIDSSEIYKIIASIAYAWLQQIYGGSIIDGKLVIE